MRKITLIVIHCSATRCNQRYSINRLRADHNVRFHNKSHNELEGIHKDYPCFNRQEYRDYFANIKP